MILVKAAGESKKILDYIFRKLGLDEKYVDLASANRAQVFIQGLFFFLFFSCFFASLWNIWETWTCLS